MQSVRQDVIQYFIERQHQSVNTRHAIITPNQRMALYLQRDWQDWHLQQTTAEVWQPLDVQPWSQWCNFWWSTLVLQPESQIPGLLTPADSLILWQQILTEDQLLSDAQKSSLARQALQADELARHWYLPIDADSIVDLRQNQHMTIADHQLVFVQWQIKYQAMKRSMNRVDTTDILLWLRDKPEIQASVNYIFQDQSLWFYGFVELTPLQTHALAGLQHVTIDTIDSMAASEKHSNIALNTYADDTAELEQAAYWAQAQWRSFKQLQTPPKTAVKPRIGIVVFNLKSRLSEVKAVFRRVFAWEHQRLQAQAVIDSQSIPIPWTVSAGLPLLDYPLIYTAHLLISWAAQALHLRDIERLLASDAWGQQLGQSVSKDCLNFLRHKGQIEWTLTEVIVGLKQFYARHNLQRQSGNTLSNQPLAALITLLETLVAQISTWPKQQTWPEWVDTFISLLGLAQWPGEGVLDSDHFQVLSRWHQWMLAQQADLIPTSLTAKMAAQRLQLEWRENTFQPEADSDEVQVLGVLEAAGISFDALWCVGLTADVWPEPAQPNPLLPYDLQRQYGVPRATPSREMQYAQAVLQLFHQRAHHLVLSYAKTRNSVAQMVSPLVYNLVERGQISQPTQYNQNTAHLFATLTLENFSDQLPKFTEKTALSGGSQTISQQALCPFRGAIAARLGPRWCQPLEPIKGLISGADRGQWLHQCMEKIWTQLSSQAQLNAQSPEDISQLIQSTVEQIIRQAQRQLPLLLTPMMMQVESKLLTSLCQEALEFDLTSPAFSIFALEKRLSLSLGLFELTLQIDRIDQRLDTQTYHLMDYKSAKPSQSEQRLISPQLILYTMALLDESLVMQSAEYRVISRKDKVQSLGGWGGDLAGKDPQLDHPQRQQQEQLIELITELEESNMALEPVEPLKTCQSCSYRSSCRRDQRVLHVESLSTR